ncbi:unnamed protein product, partial [Protopolystoma xenopodis]
MAIRNDDSDYDAGETSRNVPRPRSYSGNYHAYNVLRTRFLAYICQLSYACEHASSVDYCHLRCGGCLLCNQHKRANSFKPESSSFDRQHLAAHSAATKLTGPVLSESKETPLANGPSQALEPVR